MSAFLEALIARSFTSTPSAIRPRPVARFEVADPDGPYEDTPDGVPASRRVTSRTTAQGSAGPGGGTQAAQTRARPESGRVEVYRAPGSGDARGDVLEPPSDAPARARPASAGPRGHEPDILEPQVREPVMQRVVEHVAEGPPPPVLVENAPPLLGPPRPIHGAATEPVRETRAPDGTRTERIAAPAAAPQVEVEITIGRIELGAPPRPPAPPPQPRSASPRPAVTLDEYLHRRSGGR